VFARSLVRLCFAETTKTTTDTTTAVAAAKTTSAKRAHKRENDQLNQLARRY
jgi:hypothetical protein